MLKTLMVSYVLLGGQLFQVTKQVKLISIKAVEMKQEAENNNIISENENNQK